MPSTFPLRHFHLSRGDVAQVALTPQSVTTVAEKLWDAEFALDGALGSLRYRVGVDANYGGPIGERNALVGRGFVSLSHPW